VPGIVRWPGKVPAGHVLNEPVSHLDLFATLADLLRVPVSRSDVGDHVIDGRSLVALLTGEETASPHDFFFHYCYFSVHAVRYRERSGKEGLADWVRLA
jgi:arylsulfatase A-like enzyme